MTKRTGVAVAPHDPADDEQVGALVVDAYDRIGTISDAYRAQLRDVSGRVDAGSTVLVASDASGRPVGTVTVVAAGSEHFEHDGHADGGFRALAVAPDAQGLGVGRALLDAVLAHARASGWRRLAITSMAWMHRAHQLYERAGFVRRPDLDVRYPSGVGLAYTLDLAADAAAVHPAPGPVPDEPPWFEDVRPAGPSCC